MDQLMVYNDLADYTERFNRLVDWCHTKFHTVHVGMARVKDLFMTPNHFQQELAETLRRVEELEKELSKVKSEKDVLEKEVASRSQQNLPPQPPIPAIPPPPPPPPPPVIHSRKLIIKRRNPEEKMNLQTPFGDGKLVVTADDLKSIKLKTPGERCLQNRNNNLNTPVVQLQDLKRVSLRKTQSAVSLGQTGKENLQRMITNEVALKRKLRRTSCKRSPGGTPIINTKRRRESGTGLTPVMTRALRKKFKAVQANSSDDSNNSGSAFSSPDFTSPVSSTNTSMYTPNPTRTDSIAPPRASSTDKLFTPPHPTGTDRMAPPHMSSTENLFTPPHPTGTNRMAPPHMPSTEKLFTPPHTAMHVKDETFESYAKSVLTPL